MDRQAAHGAAVRKAGAVPPASSNRWRAHAQNENLPYHVRCSFPEALFQRIEAALGTKKATRVSECSVVRVVRASITAW